MYGPGHRLFRRSWQYFHNLLALARLLRQAGKLPFGLREQAVERLLQRALRRVERRRLALDPGVVMSLSLPFIPSIAGTLEFYITTGYPFRHA